MLTKRLLRFFTENLFKDKEGRFKMRWDIEDKTSSILEHPQNVPDYKGKIDFPVNKKRIFDFDLPQEMKLLETPLQIWSVADGMFSVNNVWIPGPILIFPEAVFQWHAPRLDDIEDYHLDILKIIQPRPEYVLVGTGRAKVLNYLEGVRKRFRSININIDMCPTFEACATFNLTAEEGRKVCAFLLPQNFE